MVSKGGNHTVDFEIRGNDSYTKGQEVNPNNYAIATLTFTGGVLTNVVKKSSGQVYTFLGQANANSNEPLVNADQSKLVDTIPINHSLLESWYGQPYTDYQDWYLLTETTAQAKAVNGGRFGILEVSIQPKSQEALNIIANTPVTTGYSKSGSQQKYERAQAGTVELVDSLNQRVGNGTISNGSSKFNLTKIFLIY
jgi:hypothetical protein